MPHPVPSPRPRDQRVDFFRGLALIFIFIDHIPDNAFAYATLKNFGFSDASEVFVLLSGYSAALAYGVGSERGPRQPSLRRAIRRAFRIYLWHLGIFALCAALLFTAADVFANPAYVDNVRLHNLAADPLMGTFKALTLTYQIDAALRIAARALEQLADLRWGQDLPLRPGSPLT